jgi:PhnB protein
MSKSMNFKPDNYHTITPYLIVDDASQALDFYKNAFNAIEIMRFNKPDGKIGHAEIKIGDSFLMLADEQPQMNTLSPKSLGGSPICMHLYVEDVDALYHQALAAGGAATLPVEDKFYGDRSGTLTDPFGHVWCLSTHTEDLNPKEINERMPK